MVDEWVDVLPTYMVADRQHLLNRLMKYLSIYPQTIIDQFKLISIDGDHDFVIQVGEVEIRADYVKYQSMRIHLASEYHSKDKAIIQTVCQATHLDLDCDNIYNMMCLASSIMMILSESPIDE